MSPALSILIAAIIRVESGGDLNAVGRAGELGCMQIRPAVIEDANRIEGYKRFRLDHRLGHGASIEIFRVYVGHYATEARIGREPTIEDMARIWNGGPDGYRKRSTLRYWKRVKTQIENFSK